MFHKSGRGDAFTVTENGKPIPAEREERPIRFFRFSADNARGRKLWRWLRPLVGLGLLAFLLWRVDWREMAGIISQASVGYVLLALFIELLNMIPKVMRWRALLLTQGTQASFFRLLPIYFEGAFFSNCLPSAVGGDSMRMWRMAQLTGQGADAVSSVLIERLLGLFAVLLMGVVAVLSNWQLASAGGIGFFVLGAFAAFILGMLLLFSLQRLRSWADHLTVAWLAALVDKLVKLYDSIYAFRSHKRALLTVLVLSLLFRLVSVLGLYVQSLALHIPISFIWLMMILCLISVVSAVPLSMNSLGIKEGAYVFFFGLVGVAAPQAFALALLSRGVILVVSLMGGVIYLLGK